MTRIHIRRRLAPGRREELRRLARRSAPHFAVAAVVGAAVGLVVAVFERAVVEHILEATFDLPVWALAVSPLVGLLIAALILRTVGRGISPATSDVYLQAFHDASAAETGRTMLARTAASVATLGSGVPMGLEGPSLYLGSSIGAAAQRRLPRLFGGMDRRVLLVAGAAAGVSAIFKAPATGAVFALEVPFQGDLARRMLLPALVSSATGYLAFVTVNGTGSLFPVEGQPAFDLRDLAGAAVLGVAAGFAARLFAFAIRRAKRVAEAHHPLLRAVVAGVVIAGIFAATRGLTGESLSVGPGYRTLDWALDPEHSVLLVLAILVLRSLATTAAVVGGGVGGLFVPLVIGGALTGRVIGGAFDALDTSLFVVIGIAAFLGAGYRVPLAAVMFVAETTGRPAFVVPGLLAAVAAELVMGPSSITNYQAASDP